MTKLTIACVAALLAATALPSPAQTVAEVAPVLQTPILTEADADADADDPAIFVNADDAAKSFVVLPSRMAASGSMASMAP